MNDEVKFYRSAEQLNWMISQTGITGEWEQRLNSHYIFRAKSGAVPNWWSSTKTVYFQRVTKAAHALKEALLRNFDPIDGSASSEISKPQTAERLLRDSSCLQVRRA